MALAELRERLVGAEQDFSEVLAPAAARAAEALRAAVLDPATDLAVTHALGRYHWLRHQALPEGRNQDDLDAAVQYLAPIYLADLEAVPEPVRRLIEDEAAQGPAVGADATVVTRCAIIVFAGYKRTLQRELLDRSIVLFRAALAATPEDHPKYAGRLNNLGHALLALFECTERRAVLVETVLVRRQAAEATPEDHPDRAVFLNDLGNVLQTLFECTGQLEAIAEAVAARRAALGAIAESDPDRTMYLNNLGISSRTLFERTWKSDVLAEAVAAGRGAVQAAGEDHPSRAVILSNLALAMQALFEATGRREALTEAVAAGRASVAATAEDDPDRAMCLNSFGNTLQTLFGATGESDVLVEAVAAGRGAVAATPEDHPDRAMYLNSLGIVLRTQFQVTGRRELLAESLEIGRDAVAATPEDHPDRAWYLNSLGAALQVLYEHTGRPELLAEAVAVGRDAVGAAPEDHPVRAVFLNNFGNALRMQFQSTGELAVLSEAVAAGRGAIKAIPEGHPNRAGYLNSLGIVLQMLFRRTGQEDDVVEAVQTGRAAVDGTPDDHPDRARRLNNLGSALCMMFGRTEELGLLAGAVAAGRGAVAATAEDHSELAIYLDGLGTSLQLLFERTGHQEVLAEAVAAGRSAVAATPKDHPDRAIYLKSLGDALHLLFERTREASALFEARHSYRQAASNTAGATMIRIKAYRQLAALAVEARDPEDGLRCVEAAIDLVEVLAPGSLARADREYHLGRLSGLAGEAAAAALTAGRPARAVELLERTRGILAAEALGLHRDGQTRLRATAPDLADRLEQLRHRLDLLDQPRPAHPADAGLPATAQQASENDRRIAGQRRELHAAWLSLLEEIRAIPGFADFFRAPPIAALAGHAHDGPIVFVTTSPTRADALILTDTPDPVHTIALTGLTQTEVYEQTYRLLASCHTAGGRDLPAALHSAQDDTLAILAWLWDTIAEPVLTHLGYTSTPTGDEPWPRIWWCPVGTLAFLPLHAAGDYTLRPTWPERPRTVPDLAVSSYTPTVRALAHARSPRPVGRATSVPLIVPVPDLPGAELPGVITETKAIKRLIPGVRTLDQPTRAAVLEALPAHQSVHFSCHGHGDWEQPASSSLILTDHATNPLILADIAALHLDADLAYLSACSTTVTPPRLADESLHITGAFYLAGYRHVIGTLWPIDDVVAAEVAEDFYRCLIADGITAFDPDQAAIALHHATTSLRDRYPTTPTLWAAYTHTGAWHLPEEVDLPPAAAGRDRARTVSRSGRVRREC